ncbi:kinesin-like protein KIN-14U [Benincasa hispida]|uniref:kinesin-like protein KIN-14U n=1 Tax=Benincasa hispida TaxID=102211 RepID=UPI0019017E91|nr:kinesin-like protein KIN-14U [Benincasa hispida]
MFICEEKEQILLCSATVMESMKSLSPVGSNLDSSNAIPLTSVSSDSPLLPSVYTDVNIVSEHENAELHESILNLEGEIEQLRLKLRASDEKRREALNKILDIKGSIRVFCRVRPFLLTDRRRICEPILLEQDKVRVRSSGTRKEFEFDKIFSKEASQEEIYSEVEPIIQSALDGRNVCIIAYGQTGTGKTYTMDGKMEQPGIVPRALEMLFRQTSSGASSTVTFSMSMLEVYMGSLRDLLAPKAASRMYERCNLNIQTDQKGFVEIEGLTEVPIPDFEKARWWYNKGRRVRSTSWTNVNETSSRSHCLTKVTIYRCVDASKAKTEVSKLWMVDLGGSERLLKTGACGLTLDEGRAINLSLSALGDVIAALRRKRGHVPYRNSKLTQILKDSLGDGSKVLMLVHLSPCEEDVAETVCSLSFAKRVRAIETSRELQEDLKKQREKRIAELDENMKEAQGECQKVKNQIQKAEFLLSENKKLLSTDHHPCVETPKMKHIAPGEDRKEVIVTPRKSKIPSKSIISNSLPRFMTSTMASRQRQSAAENKVVMGRAKSLRFGARSSVQFSSSQSMSYSDFRIRASLQLSNKKSRYVEPDTLSTETPQVNVSEPKKDTLPLPLPQSKLVISSDSNLRVTLSRHRRRMSDLI